MESKLLDHLFRHHSAKMVTVLTRIFGLKHLDVIEDAVQDTFIKATISWRKAQPKNPEAWLTQIAKNRVLDIFRKLKTAQKYHPSIHQGTDTIAMHDLFLDSEIEDAQLRMIFTACHPKLDPKDRISFALKTMSGFSIKEIASALLTKEATIKKRLSRARKTIQQSKLKFTIPQGKHLPQRLNSVLEVLYLIFNEGFHSNNKEKLIKKELCGEAMRLTQILLKNSHTRVSKVYALFALMSFHAARLETKTNTNNQLLDLKHQNRQKWHLPLIKLGHTMMHKAVKTTTFSCYHYEAAIAAEHLKASHFHNTNWDKIHHWYQCLYKLQPMPSHILNMAVICLQKQDYTMANIYLNDIKSADFEQRAYLFYAAKSDYHTKTNNPKAALKYINLAISTVQNKYEAAYLQKKKNKLIIN